MTCPHCGRAMTIEAPMTDGGAVMQQAHCLTCGHDLWRDVSTPRAEVPIMGPDPRGGKLPDLICAACGKAPVKRSSHRYCAGCSGTEAACQHCRASKERGHGPCSAHGGLGKAARYKLHFQSYLQRKRRRMLVGAG